jgi:hypothetical protein
MRAIVYVLSCLVVAPWLPATAVAQQAAPAAPPAGQASNDDVRISGTVEKFTGGLMSVSPSQGVSLTLRFGAGPGINSMRRGTLSDLKAGLPVAVQDRSNPAGGLLASQVVLYERGAENVPGMQTATEPGQLVVTLSEISVTSDGPQLSLSYADGARKLTLAKDVVIWIARPASVDDIKPGALITLAVSKPPEGEMTVIRASIGPSGGVNPPL